MNEHDAALVDKLQAAVDEGRVSHLPPPNNLPSVAQPRHPKPAPAKPEPKQYPPRLAKALLAVTRDIGFIGKEGRNDFQKYNYARWEDINDKLSPLLAEHGLIVIQSETSRNLIEENDKGSTLAIVYEFTIVNEHGESWPPIAWTAISRLRDQKGITDDKAAAKCHTQAEKYFCIKQFKIRTSDAIDNDAGDSAISTLPKKDSTGLYKTMQAEIDAARSVVELQTWGAGAIKRVAVLPPDWQAHLRLRYNKKMADLGASQQTETWDEETGEIQAPPSVTDYATDGKWDALSPAQQAGILCNELAFASFCQERAARYGQNFTDSAGYVRMYCLVQSRADIKVGHVSGKLWRELVAEYRAWQREPAIIDPPQPAQPQNATAAGEAPASSPSPAGEDAGATIPTDAAYVAQWNAIIDSATNATQLGKTWNSQRALRDKITWTDDMMFPALRQRVDAAIKFLKQPAG